MNRRSFLALIGSGVIGAGLDLDKLLWQPGVRTFFLPPTAISPLWSWESKAVAAKFAEYLESELRFRPRSLGPEPSCYSYGWKVGNVVIERGHKLTLTDQYYVAPLSPTGARYWHNLTTQEYGEQHLKPAAHALADGIHDDGVRVFAPLPLPKGVLSADGVRTRKGLEVRMVQVYDIMTDTTPVRFDVLGGRA